jgi:DNA gyrase subunit A
MKLNPHGDAAIYETMVRLSAGYEALLTPFVDSKGNFGKVFSRDMSYAASRYTEAKLAPICAEVFRDIDKDTVDLVDNYDGSMKEPSLLPTAFPNVLVSANNGIAVGMASMICGFNLNEVCETAINYLRDPGHDLFLTLLHKKSFRDKDHRPACCQPYADHDHNDSDNDHTVFSLLSRTIRPSAACH